MDIYSDNNAVDENNFTVPGNATVGIVASFEESPEIHHQYIISLILSCTYTIFLFPIGFIGNILILVVNYAHSGHLSSPDLYFVNLAVADLWLVADSLIEVFNLKKGYYDKAALCTFVNLFQQVNMYSSVFFLTWMSLDRYVALTGSMGRRMPCPRLSCVLIWAFSVLLTVLPFAVAQVQHAGELHFCFANVTQIEWLEVMLGFLLPFCVLGVCYWKIARVLQRSQRQENTTLQKPRRQKAQGMISAAVVVFFLCWLPENVFVSVHLVRTDTSDNTLWQDYPLTGHAVRLAAFSNSCLNPLIYSFLGETFQDKLRIFLHQKTTWAKLHRSESGRTMCATGACRCPSSQSTNLGIKSQSRSVIYPSNEQLNTPYHTIQ